MAYPKRLIAPNFENQKRAINSHAAFVRFIASEVKKRGMKKVLTSEKGDEYYWLRKAWDRVLNFAEEVQLKQIPQKLEGNGEEGEFIVKVEISDEDKTSQQSGNRISEYFEI